MAQDASRMVRIWQTRACALRRCAAAPLHRCTYFEWYDGLFLEDFR